MKSYEDRIVNPFYDKKPCQACTYVLYVCMYVCMYMSCPIHT